MTSFQKNDRVQIVRHSRYGKAPLSLPVFTTVVKALKSRIVCEDGETYHLNGWRVGSEYYQIVGLNGRSEQEILDEYQAQSAIQAQANEVARQQRMRQEQELRDECFAKNPLAVSGALRIPALAGEIHIVNLVTKVGTQMTLMVQVRQEQDTDWKTGEDYVKWVGSFGSARAGQSGVSSCGSVDGRSLEDLLTKIVLGQFEAW